MFSIIHAGEHMYGAIRSRERTGREGSIRESQARATHGKFVGFRLSHSPTANNDLLISSEHFSLSSTMRCAFVLGSISIRKFSLLSRMSQPGRGATQELCLCRLWLGFASNSSVTEAICSWTCTWRAAKREPRRMKKKPNKLC
jgi:hypothetical protein